MLAVKLHRAPRPPLVKGSCLVPIVAWRAGAVQIRTWRRWNRRDRYLALVRICVAVGPGNLVKQVVWPPGFRPLREWPPEYLRSVAAWWDAPGWTAHEPGGLLVDEPRLFLGRALPAHCVRWTKDLRLLRRKRSPRRPPTARREEA